MIGALTDQKTTLERKGKGQQTELDALRNEIETLRNDRELIQKRIASLLDRITECGV